MSNDPKIKAIATDDVRGILAIGAMLGFFVVILVLIWLLAGKSITVQDLITILSNVSPIALIGFGFYFGQKSVTP
jgi:hypothetical protein